MLFIYPMWDSKSQRIGKLKCTPKGYALQGFAELLGLIGLILLIGIVTWLIRASVSGNLEGPQLWLIAVPFAIGIIAQLLWNASWTAALRKGFEYDEEAEMASWIEEGKRVTYRYTDYSRRKSA